MNSVLDGAKLSGQVHNVLLHACVNEAQEQLLEVVILLQEDE